MSPPSRKILCADCAQISLTHNCPFCIFESNQKRVLINYYPSFFGPNGNAVKSQIWIAVPVRSVKKRLKISASLYELLQILGLTMFERTPLDQLLF